MSLEELRRSTTLEVFINFAVNHYFLVVGAILFLIFSRLSTIQCACWMDIYVQPLPASSVFLIQVCFCVSLGTRIETEAKCLRGVSMHLCSIDTPRPCSCKKLRSKEHCPCRICMFWRLFARWSGVKITTTPCSVPFFDLFQTFDYFRRPPKTCNWASMCSFKCQRFFSIKLSFLNFFFVNVRKRQKQAIEDQIVHLICQRFFCFIERFFY